MDIQRLQQLIEQSLGRPPEEVIYRDYYKYIPYYHLMYLLVKEMAADLPESDRLTVVEVGMDEGRGAASFAAGSPRADVWGIDNTVRNPPLYEVLDRYPNIKFLHQESVPPPIWLPPINIIHIDTEHTYEQAKSEFDAYKPMLAPGAVVMFDDLHKIDDEVQRLFDEIPWRKIQDDRLHPDTHFMVGINEGYGIALVPDDWKGWLQ